MAITCSYLFSGAHTYLGTFLGGKNVQNLLSSPPCILLVHGNIFVVFSLSKCGFLTLSTGVECNN